MNIKEFEERCVNEITEIFGDYNTYLTVKFDEIFDFDESFISGSVEIIFKYGDLCKKDIINMGWNESDGFGILDNECENISELTKENLFISLYFGLAFAGLGDDYLL